MEYFHSMVVVSHFLHSRNMIVQVVGCWLLYLQTMLKAGRQVSVIICSKQKSKLQLSNGLFYIGYISEKRNTIHWQLSGMVNLYFLSVFLRLLCLALFISF